MRWSNASIASLKIYGRLWTPVTTAAKQGMKPLSLWEWRRQLFGSGSSEPAISCAIVWRKNSRHKIRPKMQSDMESRFMNSDSNQDSSDPRDTLVDALLDEHARLGTANDEGLVATIRARTTEKPASLRLEMK